uniref:E3 ubiquitin-protein ligase TRIM7-like n=1 Tax=Euleptes europaea TaxID=460621 RepID=UPI00253FAE9B|nr:E3 ubiquitin-protein ligase TRIM7-like [Euleptes europaea]
MATGVLIQELCDETTCSICLDYFNDPVTITECGHNFCRACLTQTWKESVAGASCPQCRGSAQQTNLKPNWQLANFVEIAKKFRLQVGKGAEDGRTFCKRHQEPFKLFCEDDQTLICVVCDRAASHRAHMVIPMEEAAQKYKDKLQSWEEYVEKLQALRLDRQVKSQKHLMQIKAEREKIMLVMGQMHKFIAEREGLLLAQLRELEEKIEKKQEEDDGNFSKEIARLSDLITTMKELCHQPANEFLQEIKSTFRRHLILLYSSHRMNFTISPPRFRKDPALEHSSPEMELRLRSYSWKTVDLIEYIKKFKGIAQTVSVILNPNTANPYLILSKDLKSVKCGGKRQIVPENAERFSIRTCVLNVEGFLSGRRWWEVNIWEKGWGDWAVGVARESVRRQENINISPHEGIWAIGRSVEDPFDLLELSAFTFPKRTPLLLTHELKKIRVCLDYAEGKVEFFSADTKVSIFVFHSALFSEKIYPFFWVGGALRLNC